MEPIANAKRPSGRHNYQLAGALREPMARFRSGNLIDSSPAAEVGALTVRGIEKAYLCLFHFIAVRILGGETSPEPRNSVLLPDAVGVHSCLLHFMVSALGLGLIRS